MSLATEFTSLSISRIEYGPDKGRLKAVVRGSSYNTKIEVELDDGVGLAIMKMISPAISDAVHTTLETVAKNHEAWALGAPVESAAIEPPEPEILF
jgi:hypothetical protein